jgi:hypothetical protein
MNLAKKCNKLTPNFMNIQSTLFPGISPQLDQALRNCDRMTDVSAFEATLHGFHLQTSNEKNEK